MIGAYRASGRDDLGGDWLLVIRTSRQAEKTPAPSRERHRRRRDLCLNAVRRFRRRVGQDAPEVRGTDVVAAVHARPVEVRIQVSQASRHHGMHGFARKVRHAHCPEKHVRRQALERPLGHGLRFAPALPAAGPGLRLEAVRITHAVVRHRGDEGEKLGGEAVEPALRVAVQRWRVGALPPVPALELPPRHPEIGGDDPARQPLVGSQGRKRRCRQRRRPVQTARFRRPWHAPSTPRTLAKPPPPFILRGAIAVAWCADAKPDSTAPLADR